jgi:hypothetical protein
LFHLLQACYFICLRIVRRQLVQTFLRTVLPSSTKRWRCTLGRNMREVRGALRRQRPECL